jgi:hypothetical protein
MEKKFYIINGNPYLIDGETGKINSVILKDEQIPKTDLDELIKLLVQKIKKIRVNPYNPC